MPDWNRMGQQLFGGKPRAVVVPRLGGENDDPVQGHYADQGTQFYPDAQGVYDYEESDNQVVTDPVITDPAVFAEEADFGYVGKALVLSAYVGGYPLSNGPHVLNAIQVATTGTLTVYDGGQATNVPLLGPIPNTGGYINLSFGQDGLQFMNGIYITTTAAATGCFIVKRRLQKPIPAGTF